MVDFTREIKQATQTAASTPQFAAPSSSVGGDIVNAVGTGLQFFQQQQAKTDLKNLTQKQAEQERSMAQGIMGLREQRQDLVNQGMSRANLALRDKAYLSKYSPEMQLAIVSGVKKATGETLSSFSDEISAKEKEEKLSVLAVQEARVSLEDDAANAAAGMGLSVYDIEAMSDVELRDMKLQGLISKSETDAKSATLASKIQNGTYDRMTKEQQTKEYVAVAIPKFSAKFSSDLFTTVDAIGGFGQVLEGNGKEAVLDIIQQQRRSIPAILQEQAETARQAGIVLSLEQQRGFKSAAEDELKRAEELLSDEKYVKLFDQMNEKTVRQGLFKALTSGTDVERGAAMSAILSLSTGATAGLSEWSSMLKTLDSAYSGTLKLGGEVVEDDATLKEKVKTVNKSLSTEGIEGGFNEEQQQNNFSVGEQVLMGTPTEVNAYAEGLGFQGFAKSVADTEGKNFNPKDHAAVADALFDQSYKRLPAAIMAAVNAKGMRLSNVGSARDKVFIGTDTLSDFTLDAETLSLVRVDGGYAVTNQVTQYNAYMKDLLKSFKVLGVDSNRIKDFKSNAIKSMLIAKEDSK